MIIVTPEEFLLRDKVSLEDFVNRCLSCKYCNPKTEVCECSKSEHWNTKRKDNERCEHWRYGG